MPRQTINVIGVGYIGSVITLQLIRDEYRIIGIDKDKTVLEKEKWFKRHSDIRSEVKQDDLEHIETSTNYQDIEGDVSIVCVNTPLGEEGIELKNVKSAFRSLGKNIDEGHTVILRSTLPPGKSRSELIPILESVSGLEQGKEFNFCYAPEFVRGGKGFQDLREPSKTVVAGDGRAIEQFKQIFSISDNFHEVSLETAEAVKCFDNVFHGLKISLANESGRLGEEIGFDPVETMDIIASDRRLNISDMYMSPGAPYGGPCLKKDIGILTSEAERNDVETPVISSINQSNNDHTGWLVEKITEKEPDTVGLIGATYKDSFDSTVNSPCMDVASRLQDRGYEVAIYDPRVEIEDYRQVGLDGLKNTDIWIVFNSSEDINSARDAFEKDIIDLSDFEF